MVGLVAALPTFGMQRRFAVGGKDEGALLEGAEKPECNGVVLYSLPFPPHRRQCGQIGNGLFCDIHPDRHEVLPN